MPSLINSWPEWTRVYWLLCVPAALLLLWGLYRADKQQHNWHAWLPQAFHAILLNKNANQQRRSRYFLLGSAWLCALLALLGPSWEETLQQSNNQQYGSPLVIAIQLTPDMLANDLAPSRLDRVRAKVLSLLEQRGAAFTALVVYAGSAHTLVPLSNDLLTSKNLLKALQPELMPVAGQRADLAIERAVHLLEQGAQGQGQVLLISTGVSVPEQTAIQALLQQHSIQLKIIGVGTTAGAPIIDPMHGYFITDASGAIVISRLNSVSLQLLSKQTNSPYIQLNNDDSDLDTLGILTHLDSNLTATFAERSIIRHDQGYWFILPLLWLFAGFARRGGLLLVLVCLLPTPSFALEFDDLWLRPDQQGLRLLEQQQPALAAQFFADPLWRATALYLAEDYTAAAQLFAHTDTPEAHYNRGNALALAGLLPEAIQAYQQALSQAPEMLAAQFNLAVTEDFLNSKQDSNPNNNQTDSTQEHSATVATTPLTATAASAAVAESPMTKGARAEAANTGVDSVTDVQQTEQAISKHSSVSVLQPTPAPSESPIHLESWLEQIPDNPSELLKRKFWYEYNMQEAAP